MTVWRKVQVLKRRVICRQRTFRHAEESASVTFRRKTKQKKKKVRVKEKSKIRNGEIEEIGFGSRKKRWKEREKGDKTRLV